MKSHIGEGKKAKLKETAYGVWYVISCIALALLVALFVGVLVQTIKKLLTNTKSGTPYFFNNTFEFYGFAAFFLILAFVTIFRKLKFSGLLWNNIHWLMTFTHEFTHTIFALLFFRRIHRLNADSRNSHVLYGNGPFGYLTITLSPYCIPIYMLILLPWRYTVPDMEGWHDYLFTIDVLVGLTYAFHIYCWLRQTRLYQSDITGPGKVRSILYITLFQLINLNIFLLLPGKGVLNTLTKTFYFYPGDVITAVKGFFTGIVHFLH